jgi:hypothetical protein
MPQPGRFSEDCGHTTRASLMRLPESRGPRQRRIDYLPAVRARTVAATGSLLRGLPLLQRCVSGFARPAKM